MRSLRASPWSRHPPLHTRADVYPDPFAFRPERFLEKPAGTYTWIPFGGGVRRCLGATFALFEMKGCCAPSPTTSARRAAARRGRHAPRDHARPTAGPRHPGAMSSAWAPRATGPSGR